MHTDLEQSDLPSSFCSSVCIIGAGIAGLTTAARLLEHGIDVNLIEAGGLTLEARSQAFYHAEMSGECHHGTHEGRFRTFGGSSTRWGGQVLPYTEDIFAAPPESPSASWPITGEKLAPYYGAVEHILGVNDLPFTCELLQELGNPAVPQTDDVRVRFSKWAPFRKRNMADSLGKTILQHPGAGLFTHANATWLTADPSDPTRIKSVRVLNYAGKQFTFSAKHFIVCLGTVESSRFLLCSPDVPNPYDQIGRYFHDHISFHAARFVPPAREQILRRLGPFFVHGTLHTCKLEAASELRAREGLLAVMAHIAIVEPDDSGIAAFRNLLRSMQRGQLKRALLSDLLPTFRGAEDVLRLIYNSHFKRRRAVSKNAVLYLNIDLEQEPDPENRIRLSSQQFDQLGLPVAIVDWKIGESEEVTACRYAPIIRSYLQSLDLDPKDWVASLFEGRVPQMTDTFHAMGGLRMGDDPTSSVVDPDLKVHGVANLSVASCAVFPSGGSSNPTFTMMALALRLADHIANNVIATAADSLSASVALLS